MRARIDAGRVGLTIVLALGLAGCVSAENEARSREAREAAGLRPERVRMSEDEVRAFFVGATRVTSAARSGSQITYMAPGGSAYLWFPGNAVILRGRWSIEQTGGYRPYAGKPVSEYSVCFVYGAATINVFDGRRGGKSCVPAEIGRGLVQDRAPGDIFGLEGRTAAPFVLPPERTSIAAVRSRIGRG